MSKFLGLALDLLLFLYIEASSDLLLYLRRGGADLVLSLNSGYLELLLSADFLVVTLDIVLYLWPSLLLYPPGGWCLVPGPGCRGVSSMVTL